MVTALTSGMRTNRIIWATVMLLSGSVAFGQSSVEALGGASDAAQRVFDGGAQQPPDPIWDAASVQVAPEFPGGQEAMFKYLQRTIQYPAEEMEAGIQGKVYLRFIVGKNGAVQDVAVARGVSPGLDAEAMRAVKTMPNWIPGLQNGKPVKVRFVLPVSFKLAEPAPAKD